MLHKKVLALAPLLAILACSPDSNGPVAPEADMARAAPPGRGGALGTIYVTSQGLWYDTFVSAESLPFHGRFQKLNDDHTTEFGPGEPGYLGGRWWIDNPDPEEGMGTAGVMDEYDTYVLCPLLGPGRPNP